MHVNEEYHILKDKAKRNEIIISKISTVEHGTEAATGAVLQKYLFLKILQYSQESTCVGVSC